jgi:hypothetical protein
MKSNRRAIRLSLGLVTIVALATWLAWDRWPCGASMPRQDAARSSERLVTIGKLAASSDDEPEENAAGEQSRSTVTPQVDFTGQWQLDTKASDSLDAILTAIGLSIIERALVNNTVVTHVIAQSDDEFTIEVKTAFFSRTDHLPLNGELAQTTDPGGRLVESVSVWSDDGKQLITKILVKREQQRFTMTRSMDELHDMMEVLIEFFPKQGKPMTSRRVYQRVTPVAGGKSS